MKSTTLKKEKNSWEKLEEKIEEQNFHYMMEFMGPNFLVEYYKRKSQIGKIPILSYRQINDH